METRIERLWHNTAADEVVGLLGSDSKKGLDRFEVEARQSILGQTPL